MTIHSRDLYTFMYKFLEAYVMEAISVAEARSGLSSLVARFRKSPDATPVAIGSHRRPEIVVLSVDAYRRLSTESRSDISLERLRRLKPVIERLAQAAKLTSVRVFGSVARGEETAHSDVDLLVAPGDDATLFDVAQFELDMEVLLGVPVSAVSERSLDEKRDAGILREAVTL